MPRAADGILAAGGAVAVALGESFEPRAEQLRMAAAVERAMAQHSHLLVEAGTGVGKSFAYLLPAVLRCIDHGETVVVCTNTIALQEQLVRKDIPLLAAAVSGGAAALRPVLVKGRGNYVSIRRLKLASARADRLLPDAASRRSLEVIEDWAYETEDGTLSTLPTLERPGVWDKVQSDSSNCMGRRCPTYDTCFYQRARREMEQGNLLICNHAIFFADLALRARGVGFLPTYQHVVLDEAHSAEDVAAEHFGRSLTEGRVNHLLATLYHARGAKGYLPQLALEHREPEAVVRAMELVEGARDASRRFFEGALDYAASITEPSRTALSRPPSRGVRIRVADAFPDTISDAMRQLAAQLTSLKDGCASEADRFELNSYAQRAGEIADAASFLTAQSLPGYAYWIDAQTRDGDGGSQSSVRATVAGAPVDVAPLLKQFLFNGEFSVTLTSATLSTRRVSDDETPEAAELAFAHILSRLGCEGARTVQLGSPFDYAEQARLMIDLSVPSQDDPAYADRLADRVLHHVRATDGGAFVLFTSFATLNAVAHRVRAALQAAGNAVLVHGADGSRSELLAAFRADPRAVLFGAASFWQGIDVQGQGLRNVIITKLPFEPPDHPLTEARLERIAAQGGDPFKEDSLPRAIIRFKQGFGRLIRSRTDRGQVVVLDPRISKSWYGKRFLAALPEGAPIQTVRT